MRVNLKVPKTQIPEAIEAGAQFDGITWYIQYVPDLEAFKQWLPSRMLSDDEKRHRQSQRDLGKLDNVTTTTGEDYKPVKHKDGCNVPPWEDCGC